MPTYEYKCAACGHKFEKFQSIKADPIKQCPECGEMKVDRLIGTGAGLIFKGSGFYITDYRDASYKDKAKSESGGGKESKEGAAAGSESKPAGDGAKPAAAPAASASSEAPKAAKSDGGSSAAPAPAGKPAEKGGKKSGE